MKSLLFLSVLSIITYSQASVVPASTTLIRQSTSIAHPSSVTYTETIPPVAISYSAPLAYSHSVVPGVYSQHLLAPAHYASPLFGHGSLLAQQSIFAQYPGLIAHNPVLAQYPVAQAPVIDQLPVQGVVQGPVQGPVLGGSPVIEAADTPQFPQIPPQQQPIPQPPPQQSPILGGAPGGTAIDDDTVSIEAA